MRLHCDDLCTRDGGVWLLDDWLSTLNKPCDGTCPGTEGHSQGHGDMDEHFTEPFSLCSKLPLISSSISSPIVHYYHWIRQTASRYHWQPEMIDILIFLLNGTWSSHHWLRLTCGELACVHYLRHQARGILFVSDMREFLIMYHPPNGGPGLLMEQKKAPVCVLHFYSLWELSNWSTCDQCFLFNS